MNLSPWFILLPVLVPIVSGFGLLVFRFKGRLARDLYVEGVTILTSILTLIAALGCKGEAVFPISFPGNLTLTMRCDGMSMVFALLVAFLWPFASLYAFCYMEPEKGKNRFFAFYTATFGVTLGIAFSANLMTMYLFYELLTLITTPLVCHEMDKKSIHVAMKYLCYNIGGATLAFIGLCFISILGGTTEFVYGGVLDAQALSNNLTLVRGVYIVTFIGFGVKSALFPFQNWLPAASIAPTPVTALLHAVAVVNAGAFAVIRVTYYNFGTEMLRGSWAQWIPMALCVITIVYGSARAVKEPHFKRRLAFSTVSNLSYILLGASLMSPAGLTCSLTHMVFHGIIKINAFFCAGAVMTVAKRNYVSEMAGIGRKMPITMAAFTVSACALVGIPPFNGFVSKWKLVSAGVTDGSVMGMIGGIAIFVSAMLTVVYMFSIVIKAFFPGKEEVLCDSGKDPGWMETVPVMVFCVLMLLTGLFPQMLIDGLASVATGLC